MMKIRTFVLLLSVVSILYLLLFYGDWGKSNLEKEPYLYQPGQGSSPANRIWSVIQNHFPINNEGNSAAAVASGDNGADENEEQEDLDSFMRKREEEYARRRLRLRKVCEVTGEKLRYRNETLLPLGRLRWLNERKLILCIIFKVCSTTWGRIMLDISHSHLDGVQKNSKIYLFPPYPRESEESLALMQKYSKIIIVRHPFARLVSYFRDKISGRKDEDTIRDILKNFRNSSSSQSNDRAPTFKEFVSHLLDNVPLETDVEVKKDHFSNWHWFPYYATCAVCNFDYEVIAKMETYQDDARYLFHRFNLTSLADTWLNRGGVPSEEIAVSMFKALPRYLTLGLYRRYLPDFQMFDYSVEKYLAAK